MCGGVIFPFRKEYREMLAQYYSPDEVEEFEKSGQVRSLYWQRGEPVLPVLSPDPSDEQAREEILRWGNRDKNAPFPQTGWARLDSIEAGKWSYLKPEPVLIPVTYGVEKGKWFSIANGIRGLTVQRGPERRVYMLTDRAAEEFLEMTGHERMPVLLNQSGFPWLPGDPLGANYAP